MFFNTFGAPRRQPESLTKRKAADGHRFRLRCRHVLKLICWCPSRSKNGSDVVPNVAHSAGPGLHPSPTMCWMSIHVHSVWIQIETEASPARKKILIVRD